MEERHNKRRCGELPEQVISYILSKAEDGRYVAAASSVCKSWNRSSMLVSNLSFYEGNPVHWYRMLMKRLHTLERVRLKFVSADGMELCLGAIGACQRLSEIKLDLEFQVPLVNLFNILSVSNTLTSFVLWSRCDNFVDVAPCIPLVRLKSLVLFRISIEVTSRTFLSAFPVLETFEYHSPGASFTGNIESTTLQRLTVHMDSKDYLHVKAPKLTSLEVSGVARLHCESASSVTCFKVTSVCEVFSDAAEIRLLEVKNMKRVLLFQFPNLVSVKTLIFKLPDYSFIDKLPSAALDSVESAALYATRLNTCPVRSTCLRLMKRLRCLNFTAGTVDVNQIPVILPHLKSLRYFVASSVHDPCTALRFIVDSSPAIELVEVIIYPKLFVKASESEVQALTRMYNWLFQLKHSKPDLVINATFHE